MQGFVTCPSSLSKQRAEQDLTPGLLLLLLPAELGVCLCVRVCHGEKKGHWKLFVSLVDKPIHVGQIRKMRFMCGNDNSKHFYSIY